MSQKARKTASSNNQEALISPEVLDFLKSFLVSGSKNDKDTEVNIDPSDNGSVMKHLVTALMLMHRDMMKLKMEVQEARKEEWTTVEGKGVREEVKKLREVVRQQGDELDEGRQRELKGNLILSSPHNHKKNLVSLFPKDEELGERSLKDHVLELINNKWGVRIPEADIQALHRLPNNSIVLRVWRRTEGSAWSKLVDKIKTGGLEGKRDMNLFLNFQLTRRRGELVREMRNLKKDGLIFKFWTDENGVITFKANKEDASKVKVTYHWTKDATTPEKTLTKAELLRLVEPQ